MNATTNKRLRILIEVEDGQVFGVFCTEPAQIEACVYDIDHITAGNPAPVRANQLVEPIEAFRDGKRHIPQRLRQWCSTAS